MLKETSKILANAPLAIAVYNTRLLSGKIKLNGRYKKICEIFEIQSVAAAIQNIVLMAYCLGLGSAWLGIALLCEKEINTVLKQQGLLLAILTIGYPDEFPKKPKRKKISEISNFK